MWQSEYITLLIKEQGGIYGNIHANHGLHLPDRHHPVHHRADGKAAMKGKPITVRLFVPCGGAYRPFDDLSESEKASLRESCTARMGNAMNDYFSRHIGEYKRCN